MPCAPCVAFTSINLTRLQTLQRFPSFRGSAVDTRAIPGANAEYFLKNQMTWRVVERVDGQPWLEKPVTLQDASTQVSPFVILN